MEVGIEFLASGVERFYVVLEERLEEKAVGHLNTRMQVLKVLSMALRKGFR